MTEGRVRVQKYLGGIVGLIIALVLETFLFMARSTMADSANLGKKYLHLVDPVKHAQLQAGSTPDLEQTYQTAPRFKDGVVQITKTVRVLEAAPGGSVSESKKSI